MSGGPAVRRRKPRYPSRTLGGHALEGVEPCHGKVSYSTFTAARKAAGRVRIDSGDAARLSPYQCRECHRFHVGNNFVGQAPR